MRDGTRTARPGGHDLSTRRSELRSAVVRFLSAGMLSLGLVAVPSALLMQHLTREHVLDELEQRTVQLADDLVAPLVTPAVLAGDAAALAALDDVLRVRMADGSVLRITVWAPDGRVVYSDAPHLVGASFPEHDWDEQVLEAQVPVASFEDDGEPSHGYEPEHGRFVEVDTLFTASSGDLMIFEAYYPASVVHRQQGELLLRLLPVGLGTLLVLQLAQLPQAARLVTRIQGLDAGRRRLLRQAAAASDLERRRLARDLHDDVLQNLAGVSYALESVLDRLPEQERVVVDRSRDLVRTSVGQLRSILTDVYPTDLDAEGLTGALGALAGRLRGSGLDVRVDAPAPLDVDATPGTLVYRVAREAATNVVKHAGARHVDIRVAPSVDAVRVTVSDDGCGFDPDAATAEGHLGLRLVRDAVAEAGGVVEVRSALGAGTTVTATIPLR